MKRYFKIIIFNTIGISGVGVSVDRGIEVRPNGTDFIESYPKKTVTTVFRVTSKSPGLREWVTEVGLPEGWKLITQDFPIQLSENQFEMRILSFFIPQTAAAGNYEVVYQASDRRFPSLSDRYTLNVRVLPQRSLVLKIMEAPGSVIAGEPYGLRFMLNNESNVSDSVVFSAVSFEGSDAVVNPVIAFLARGESRMIEVTVRTDPRTLQVKKDRVQVQARFLGEKEAGAGHLATVDLIPRVTVKGDRHHRFPVTLALSQVFEAEKAGESGFQAEISGGGQLKDSGDGKIRFLARGPDLYQTSIYGKHDEAFVAYESERLGLHAGDKPFSLTPLLEQSRYGRGVEAHVEAGRFEAGGYGFKTRWYIPTESQAAGFVRFRRGDRTVIGFYALKKDVAERGGDVFSVNTKWMPNPALQVEAEAAAGKAGGQARKGGFIRAGGESKKLYYSLHLIYTDPRFPGYYQDTRLATAGATMTLGDGSRLNAAFRYERQKYTLDTMSYVAPLSKYAQIGLHRRLGDGTDIQVDAVYQSREDRYPVPRFHYTDAYSRLTISRTLGEFHFSLGSELGRSRDRLNAVEAFSKRFNGGLLFQSGFGLSVRGYAQYDDNRRYGGARTNRLTLGANAHIARGDRTRFSVNFQNNHSLESYYFDRDMFELGLEQRLFEGHTLAVKARRTLMRNTLDIQETAVSVDYRATWGIPIASKKSSGIVSGRIVDQETLLPLRDVIVRINGSSAVTDENGLFIFPTLKPGTYYLRLDKAKIGLNRVTVVPTPMEMVVKGGDRQNVELGVVRGSVFSGRAVLCPDPENPGASGPIGGLIREESDYSIVGGGFDGRPQDPEGKPDCAGVPNLLIEMTRKGEVLRRLTDADGRFRFEEVRPGVWDVQLYPYNLPEYHRFETEKFQITLEPGESETKTVNVLPKKRRIQFLQEGGTVVEQGNK